MKQKTKHGIQVIKFRADRKSVKHVTLPHSQPVFQTPCLKHAYFPDEEEEEENLDDQDEQGNLKGFINDDDDEDEGEEDEGSDSGDSEDDVGHKKRKRSE